MDVESTSTESGNIYSDHNIYEASSESWNGRSVTVESASNRDLFGRIVLCGEKCHGEVSADFSIYPDNNKSAEIEVEIERNNGRVSGYVSGEITQDKDGDTKTEIHVGGTWDF